MKLRKSEQALDYTKKSANVLVQTQMQYSPNGLYTMTTYAKLLYSQNKFPEATRIFTSCIGITDKVYESDTLTKGYLLQNLAAVHASMRNVKAALMYYAQAESIFHKFLDEEHPDCQTAHCGRRKPHFDFGRNACPIVPYRHLPQTLCGMTADCRSLV